MHRLSRFLPTVALALAACADEPTAATAGSRLAEAAGRVAFLIDSRDVASMRLEGPGAVILAHSPSLGTASTSGCGGTSANYPVQGVLVTTATHTYVTSIVVCGPAALGLGQTLRLAPGPPSASAGYSRFTGATPQSTGR